MLNHVELMGRFTSDPELRRLDNGTPVCSFSLAVDRDFASKDGVRQCDFIECVVWRTGAEFCSKYFSKGSPAIVTGRLQVRNWLDKDGNKRRSAEIAVEHMYFCGSKKDGNYNQREQASYSADGKQGYDYDDLYSDPDFPY